MPNLKEIRNRIVSVGSTMQITSAMKMVSAAKLKKAQDAIVQLRPYSMKLQEIIQNVSATLDGDVGGAFTKTNDSDTILIIPISSNRGLCGAFNASIAKKVHQELSENYADKKYKIETIGKKVFDLLKKTKTVDKRHDSIWDDLTPENVYALVDDIMNQYKNGEYAKVFIVYNHFKNAANQEVQFEQLLPIQLPKNPSSSTSDYIYEPDKAQIINDLIPKSIRLQLFKALLDSHASEHGARMTAMHKATDNADALRKDLVLSYNKARQAAITKEILEIVGGAEALES